MKAASQPPCTDVWILLEEGGVVKNFCGPVGQDMRPALLYRPGAVQISVS